MTRGEAKAQIERIQNNYETFINQINDLIAQANNFSKELNEIDYTTIENETAIKLINGRISAINSDITAVLTTCTNVGNTAKARANEKLDEIVNAFNRSITEESMETPLPHCSVSGGIIGGVTGATNGARNLYSGNNSNSSTPSTNETLNYYFAHATSDKLNSKSIKGWDNYIEDFLKTNELNKYVKDIEIVDGVIVCSLNNGQTYQYENVESIVDLLKKLKASINGEA